MNKHRILSFLLAAAMLLPGCTANDNTPPNPILATETEPVTSPAPVTPVEDERWERGDIPRVYITTYTPTENYALGASVTVSSEPDASSAASMATDGDDKTCWLSDLNEAQTVTIDLEALRAVGFLKLEWGKGAPKSYDIAISADGESYTTLESVTDGGRYKLHSYESETLTELRYIRLTTHTTASAKTGYMLEEVIASETRPAQATTFTTTEYKPAHIAIVDAEGGKYPTVEEDVTIKIRGNSTANTVKNPYNIKFTEKQRLLGIKGTRKWALLANLFDKTLIRNKLAADFTAMTGVDPAMESRFVEVYLDGVYKGCYTLSLPVSDGVVDVDVEEGEMLLERNGYYDTDAAGKAYNYTPVAGIRFVPIAPDAEEITEEQKKKIKNLLKEVEYAAISGDEKRLESVIDVDSFVNMYICEELMKDIDIFHGSTYFYFKNDRLYSGPIWDMDLSMGNVSLNEGYIDEKYAKYGNMYIGDRKFGDGTRNDSTTGLWAQVDFYAPLMEADWFVDRVKARYEELIPTIEYLYEDGGLIDQYLDEAGDAFLRNYEEGGYSLTQKYFTCEVDEHTGDYDDEIAYLKNWLKERDAWLRGYFRIRSR